MFCKEKEQKKCVSEKITGIHTLSKEDCLLICKNKIRTLKKYLFSCWGWSTILMIINFTLALKTTEGMAYLVVNFFLGVTYVLFTIVLIYIYSYHNRRWQRSLRSLYQYFKGEVIESRPLTIKYYDSGGGMVKVKPDIKDKLFYEEKTIITVIYIPENNEYILGEEAAYLLDKIVDK